MKVIGFEDISNGGSEKAKNLIRNYAKLL